jgi:hypothetical protein
MREGLRGRLAMGLVMTFAGTIILSFGMVAYNPGRLDAVTAILDAVLGPLVALVGAATGYYFGSREADPPRPGPTSGASS